MKLILSFILILSISFFGYGQLGYLGKRVGVEFGVGSNYAVFNNSKEFHNYTVDKQFLLPKLSFGIHKENTKGTIMHWQAVYNQLPNSEISSWSVKSSLGSDRNDIDTVWTKSDNLQFSLGFRKYKELAPIGFYIELQFKSNIVVNKSVYREENRMDFVDLNYFQSTVKYSDLSNVSVIPELGFSMGATYPMNDFMTLEIGGRFNLVLGKFRDKDGDVNLIPDTDTFHRILSSRKVFATNLIEQYASIILFP